MVADRRNTCRSPKRLTIRVHHHQQIHITITGWLPIGIRAKENDLPRAKTGDNLRDDLLNALPRYQSLDINHGAHLVGHRISHGIIVA